MSPGLYLRLARRETRGARGRVVFFIACLAVGVAAVVAVAGLAASLDAGIRDQAKPLLAADLAIEGRRPAPAELDAALAALPVAGRAEVRELVTVVAAGRRGAPPPGSDPVPMAEPGRSVLVELKAVGAGYPFYGAVTTVPDRPLAELLEADSVLAAPELLSRLGIGVGDRIKVGGERFTVAGTVSAEPDRIQIGLTVGPRLLLSLAGLERTGLVRKGSRVEYRTLVRLAAGDAGDDPAALAAAADRLREALPPSFRVESWREAQPALRRGVRRVDRFLGLVALLSLLVGGIGVAQTVRAWLAGRMDAIAVLKCLGVRPREAFALYLGQTALLGIAGSLVGLAAGVAVQLAVPSLFPDLVPAALVRPWQPAALARGLALGVGVAVLFSVAPLAGVLRVPPVRVLRRDAEPPRAHRTAVAVTVAALLAGVLAMAVVQSGSLRLGGEFTGGLAAAALLLAAAAFAVTWIVGRLPRDLGRLGAAGPWLRHGVAALARPGAATVGAIVALGLGVLVVVGMSLVERQLADELTAEVPADAPTAFLVDVQPDQWPGVESLLRSQGALAVDSVPVVMARLSAIDGAGVDRLAADRDRDRKTADDEDDDGDGRSRWALTREQRLTYLDRLPADNRIVEGALWDRPGVDEVSVETGFAEELGVHLGSRLDFDVQGVPLALTVTSLREVDWQSFGINFFLVVEPGVLDGAPQQRLATVRLPPAVEQRTQDLLAARFPNVTFIRVREILGKIVAVLDRIGLAVRFLGGFTVVAGIAILAGAVSAGSARRAREVALLKTIGVTRPGVAAMFAVEYALVGLVAGAIGAAGGAVLAWAVLTRGMDLGWTFRPLPLAVALAASALVTAAAGLAATARALARRPIEVLRGE